MFKKSSSECSAGEREYESLATVRDVLIIFRDQQKEIYGKVPAGVASVLAETEKQLALAGEAIGIR